jgi:tetratricopeptide (TPR) repeat protein
MRHANHRFFAATLATAVTTAAAIAAFWFTPHSLAAAEFFTYEEIDYIREAQGISLRVPAIIQLANIRLVYLGMKEKSKDDKALEKRIAEIHVELTKKPETKAPGQPSGGQAPRGSRGPLPPAIPFPFPLPKKDSPEVVAEPYLTDFTKTELLKGYVEAIDEIKSDIDDAYREKQDVREALERFIKFCDSSNQNLRRFQSQDRSEREAIEEARSTTQEALEAAQDALKIVPRTEKVIRP